jgi:glycosidase
MPELDVENEAVRDELKAILSFWMDLGVDGFRYDAAKHVYDTNEYPSGTPLLQLNKQFWMELRDYVKDINPDVFLIGEVWLDSNSAAPYAPGFDSLFNFDVQGKLVQTVKNEYQSNFINYVNDSISKYENKSDSFIDATFLSNHDQDRIFSQLSSSENKLRLAANLLFALPGIPFIYYGEELGMTGVKPDEKIREPFVWNRDGELPNSMWEAWVYNTKTASYEEQVNDPNSIWSMYRDLIALRKAYPVLKDGTLEALDFGNNRILGLLRGDSTHQIAHISNLGSEAVDLMLDFESRILYNNKDNTLEGMNLHLEPYGSVYLILE